MTQEDKDLLLKDLSARLPYSLIIHLIEPNENEELFCLNIPQESLHTRNLEHNNVTTLCPIEDIKPYLRPLSSMTEEEKKELLQIIDDETSDVIEQLKNNNCGVMEGKYHFNSLKEFDWLNAHHFDYRGLIEKGLALKAPDGMYKRNG